MRLAALFTLLMAFASHGAIASDDSSANSDSSELVQFVEQVQEAARSLDYAGVFTYQQGAMIVASRVIHIVDATGERERIEALDGEPREYIRHNDSIKRIIPKQKIVVKEPGTAYMFPFVVRGNFQNLHKYYRLNNSKQTIRVAGRDCDVYVLHPIDPKRYGHVLCIDTESKLLLSSKTINDANEVIDQHIFVSIVLGKGAADSQINPSWDTKNWKEIETHMGPTDLTSKGWRIPFPPGFEVIKQVSRPLRNEEMVKQLVLSDGIAALSVFIESFNSEIHSSQGQGGIHKGALSVFRKRIADYWVTVLGQVPAETVREVGDHIEYVPLVQ